MTFIPVHLRAIGMSAATITAVFAMRNLVQSLTPPLWGLWADRRGDSRQPLVLATALNTLLFVPLLFTDVPAALMIFLIIQAGAAAAFAPLSDSMTLTVLKDTPERFGRVRLPGSLAYGVGVLGFSLLFSTEDLSRAARTSLPVISGLLALAVIAAWRLPRVPRKKLESIAKAGGLLRQRELWVLFAAGALHWASHAPYNVLLGVHFQDLGLSPVIAGLALCMAVGVEMGVFWVAPRALKLADPINALRFAFVVGAVRWLVSSQTANPAVLVVTQGLHGITFGFFYVVSIAAVHRRVPEEARSTGQATFMTVVFGAGGILGTLLAGWAYDAGKGPFMFSMAAGLDVAALVLSFVMRSRTARVEDN